MNSHESKSNISSKLSKGFFLYFLLLNFEKFSMKINAPHSNLFKIVILTIERDAEIAVISYFDDERHSIYGDFRLELRRQESITLLLRNLFLKKIFKKLKISLPISVLHT